MHAASVAAVVPPLPSTHDVQIFSYSPTLLSQKGACDWRTGYQQADSPRPDLPGDGTWQCGGGTPSVELKVAPSRWSRDVSFKLARNTWAGRRGDRCHQYSQFGFMGIGDTPCNELTEAGRGHVTCSGGDQSTSSYQLSLAGNVLLTGILQGSCSPTAS